jgi:hypothetical protein
METITIEINDDGSVRVTEDEGDQTTEPMTQEFDSIGEAAQALMEMLQPSEEQTEAVTDTGSFANECGAKRPIAGQKSKKPTPRDKKGTNFKVS